MVRHQSAWICCWLVLQISWGLSIGCRVPRGQTGDAPHGTALRDPRSADQGAQPSTGEDVVAARTLPVSTGDALRDARRNAELGAQSKRKSDVNSVSYYAGAAITSWQALAATNQTPSSEPVRAEAHQQYHDNLAEFIASAVHHGQLDPHQGIKVLTPDGRVGLVQIACQGFPWTLADFNEVHLAQAYQDNELARRWTQPGFGVPLVIVRNRPTAAAHLGKSLPFAATAILRPAGEPGLPASLVSHRANPAIPVVARLEFYDPLRIREVNVAGQHRNLANDISAPLAYIEKVVNRDNYQGFLRPSRADERAGLRMLEPYQPGKIPVVFVHGLLSDSITWIDMINDLRAVPWFNDRYQVWAFQYATGQPFLRSAAEMRSELARTVREFDSQSRDPAMSSIVLIGHSMGGLVSMQQVTSSGSAIWDSIASRPLSELRASPIERDQIRSLFFFEPVPGVKRLVCIGTPHQGSEWATTLLGRVGSKLVRASRERKEMLQDLMTNNPSVFSEMLQKGIPSSVDLLRPSSPLLLATYNRPINPEVRLHTIVGTGRPFRDGTPADGVVPVSSARHPAASSEKFIDATHTGLLNHSETSDELVRILADHVREFDAGYARR